MVPRGQQSERRLATTSSDDSEANWNGQEDRMTDGQDHLLSQADALTKKIYKLSKTGVLKYLNIFGISNEFSNLFCQAPNIFCFFREILLNSANILQVIFLGYTMVNIRGS